MLYTIRDENHRILDIILCDREEEAVDYMLTMVQALGYEDNLSVHLEPTRTSM